QRRRVRQPSDLDALGHRTSGGADVARNRRGRRCPRRGRPPGRAADLHRGLRGRSRETDGADAPPVQTMLTVAEPGSAGRAWLHVFPTTLAPGEMSPSGVTFELNVGLLKPRSRGRVTLVSRDPKVPPRIDVNLLADPWDVASMVEGIR